MFDNPIIVAQRNWNFVAWSRSIVDVFGPVLEFDMMEFTSTTHESQPATNTRSLSIAESLEAPCVSRADDYREQFVVSRSFLSTVRRVIKLASLRMPTPNIQKNIKTIFNIVVEF
jgi:hypothetical protein